MHGRHCMEPILIHSSSLSRRSLLKMTPALALSSSLHGFAATPEDEFAAMEQRMGIRLGVAAIAAGSGRGLSHRGDELFPMCSTSKLLLAACVLSKVDAGTEQLKRPISYSEKDLLEYAPVTKAHVKEGALPVGELCAAAVEVSDNTAANLLLAQVGGPVGVTKFIRSLGNAVTRLDRTEPELNTALPGDPRDTTSPKAMVDSMKALLAGTILSTPSQELLISWLEKCETGDNRLRAGIPEDWRAGDKTGTGENGAIGDVGIFWPPGKGPILIAAYVLGGSAPRAEREQAIASAARVVVRAW